MSSWPSHARSPHSCGRSRATSRRCRRRPGPCDIADNSRHPGNKRRKPVGVTAATLTLWRDAFLAAGEAALTTRPDSGEALENDRLKAKLGEVMIERDLLHEKIALLETIDPLCGSIPLDRRRRRP